MTAKGEIERLGQLGRNAARKALQTDVLMNHTKRGGFIEQHAKMNGGAVPNMPVSGRLALMFVLTIVLCVALSWGFGITNPVPFALAAVVVLEVAWFFFKRRRLSRLQDQAVGLNAQLHDLKEQDFQLRYEEAKANGDFDRFNKGANS